MVCDVHCPLSTVRLSFIHSPLEVPGLELRTRVDPGVSGESTRISGTAPAAHHSLLSRSPRGQQGTGPAPTPSRSVTWDRWLSPSVPHFLTC